jgi:hypothetical protein
MLTDFGTTKGWPIYFMLGNLSKYIWAQPNSGAMHHLAYILSVSHHSPHTYSGFTITIPSYLNQFGKLSHLFMRSGSPRKSQSSLIGAENSCMPSGQKYLMTTFSMHTNILVSIHRGPVPHPPVLGYSPWILKGW